MCHENLLLQTEANNLRTRVKALQETVDALSKKNSELLVQRDAGAWLAGGEGKDVKEFIADYLQQIEELRARLLESEATCQQLRKAVSRQPGLALSPTSRIPLSIWLGSFLVLVLLLYRQFSREPCLPTKIN